MPNAGNVYKLVKFVPTVIVHDALYRDSPSSKENLIRLKRVMVFPTSLEVV